MAQGEFICNFDLHQSLLKFHLKGKYQLKRTKESRGLQILLGK